jgi:hypothetical protein
MKDGRLKECISDFELLNGELVKNCESQDILSDDVSELDYYKILVAILLNRLKKFRADLFSTEKFIFSVKYSENNFSMPYYELSDLLENERPVDGYEIHVFNKSSQRKIFVANGVEWVNV